jgi:hypothetical protein
LTHVQGALCLPTSSVSAPVRGTLRTPRAGECANILDTCSNRGGGYGANAGNAHQTPGCPIRLCQLQDGAVARGDLVVESLQLTDNRRKGVPYAKRDGTIAPQDCCSQCVGPIRSLCGDNADLRQMAAQRVEQLGALRHQKLAYFVVHQNSLMADRPYRHEPHRRSTDRFTNRLRRQSEDHRQVESAILRFRPADRTQAAQIDDPVSRGRGRRRCIPKACFAAARRLPLCPAAHDRASDALVPSPVSATPRDLPVAAGRRRSLRFEYACAQNDVDHRLTSAAAEPTSARPSTCQPWSRPDSIPT